MYRKRYGYDMIIKQYGYDTFINDMARIRSRNDMSGCSHETLWLGYVWETL